jgi:hypothetical protein
VISVGVRLEDAHETRLLLVRLGEVLLDYVGRVDDDRRPRGLIADQVGRAAEIVVDELAEEHGRNLTGQTDVHLKPEVLRDHHPLYFVGAFADLQDLLIPVEPRDRGLLHEAVAAVDLERFVRGAVR